MDTLSTKQENFDAIYPPHFIELMDIMDNLISSSKDKDECLVICLAMIRVNEDGEMADDVAPFEEAFDIHLIDETLEFAKKKAKTINDISNFVWERLPGIEIVEDDEQ